MCCVANTSAFTLQTANNKSVSEFSLKIKYYSTDFNNKRNFFSKTCFHDSGKVNPLLSQNSIASTNLFCLLLSV